MQTKIKIELHLPRKAADPICGALISKTWPDIESSPFTKILPSSGDSIYHLLLSCRDQETGDLPEKKYFSQPDNYRIVDWKVSGLIKRRIFYKDGEKIIFRIRPHTLEISNDAVGYSNIPVDKDGNFRVVETLVRDLLFLDWVDEGNNFEQLKPAIKLAKGSTPTT